MKHIAVRGLRLFHPVLAGASLRDRAIASVGALVGIALVALACAVLVPGHPLLVAPIGATAVLLFAVPASPLAQPWPILGGNVISTLVGVAAVHTIPDASIAAGVAVGGAILVMSLLRCLHPPGGAAALTAVIGGPAIHAAGFQFAFLPVGAITLALLVTGWLFHRVSGHSYPHRPMLNPAATPAPYLTGLHRSDIDLALADMGETFDVDHDDLDLLLQRAEHHAAQRMTAG